MSVSTPTNPSTPFPLFAKNMLNNNFSSNMSSGGDTLLSAFSRGVLTIPNDLNQVITEKRSYSSSNDLDYSEYSSRSQMYTSKQQEHFSPMALAQMYTCDNPSRQQQQYIDSTSNSVPLASIGTATAISDQETNMVEIDISGKSF